MPRNALDCGGGESYRKQPDGVDCELVSVSVPHGCECSKEYMCGLKQVEENERKPRDALEEILKRTVRCLQMLAGCRIRGVKMRRAPRCRIMSRSSQLLLARGSRFCWLCPSGCLSEYQPAQANAIAASKEAKLS
jgi:hypothetical protein